jgi:hypothetical protein
MVEKVGHGNDTAKKKKTMMMILKLLRCVEKETCARERSLLEQLGSEGRYELREESCRRTDDDECFSLMQSEILHATNESSISN